MELRQLRYFVAVATHGSFNRAATHLHVTQPAVSRQIKNLEEELGVPLLARARQRVVLTDAGQTFCREARALLAGADQAIQRTRGHLPRTSLRVGFVPTISARILPRAIERFQAAVPGAVVELFDLKPGEMRTRVNAGSLDVAILLQGQEAPAFRWIELYPLAPVLVLPRKHPWAKLKKILPDHLREQRLYGLDEEPFPGYRSRLHGMFEPFGVRPAFTVQTADSMATLFATLEAEGGVAVLTETVVDILPASLVSRPFHPALKPVVALAGRLDAQPGGPAEKFIELLRDEALRKFYGGGDTKLKARLPGTSPR